MTLCTPNYPTTSLKTTTPQQAHHLSIRRLQDMLPPLGTHSLSTWLPRVHATWYQKTCTSPTQNYLIAYLTHKTQQGLGVRGIRNTNQPPTHARQHIS